MTRIKFLVVLICLMQLMWSCNPPFTTELEKYYYPLENLFEPQVYIYSSQLNQNHPDEIWLYSTEKRNGEWQLNSKNYRGDLRLVQDQSEMIVDNGSLLTSLRLITYDSLYNSQSSHAIIHHANLYPFELVNSSDILLYQIQFEEDYKVDSIDQKRITTLTKNRIFKEFSNYTYEYEVLPSAVFNVKESIESEEEGLIELRFDVTETYAQFVGKIAYTKSLDNAVVFDYKLKKIYSLSDFENQYGTLINE